MSVPSLWLNRESLLLYNEMFLFERILFEKENVLYRNSKSVNEILVFLRFNL